MKTLVQGPIRGVDVMKLRLVFGLIMAVALVAALFAADSSGPVKAVHDPPLDVIFMIDESGSMGGVITAVSNNVAFIADNLDPPFHPSFALIGFGANTTHSSGFSVGNGQPHTHVDLPTDAAGLSAALGGLIASGGTEPGVEATIHAMNNLNLSGAPICAILITDEDSDGGNLATANTDLATKGAIWFGIVNPVFGNTAATYGPNVGSMSETTGGQVFNIAGFTTDPQPVLDALLQACVVAVGPPPIGGIVELGVQSGSAVDASESSRYDYTALIAALAAGAVVTLAASGWYARRRWFGQ